jgi:PadR family transcriptional regulator PadR
MEPIEDDAAVLAQLRRGTLEYCVLAHLARGPSYGQDIARALGADSVLFGSEGTLYPLLTRLRRRRWVDTTWQESPAGPPRRYHELTDEGRAALRGFVAVWEPFRTEVDRLTTGAL